MVESSAFDIYELHEKQIGESLRSTLSNSILEQFEQLPPGLSGVHGGGRLFFGSAVSPCFFMS